MWAWRGSVAGGLVMGMTLERAGGMEVLKAAVDKEGLSPRLVTDRLAPGFYSLVSSFRRLRTQVIEVRLCHAALLIARRCVAGTHRGLWQSLPRAAPLSSNCSKLRAYSVAPLQRRSESKRVEAGLGLWQASSPQEAAQLVADQVLRGDATAAAAAAAADGGETLVPTSTVLMVAGGAGALYGGYNYAVHRLGQDKVDRLVALVRRPCSPSQTLWFIWICLVL
jgi:hypothetical protein